MKPFEIREKAAEKAKAARELQDKINQEGRVATSEEAGQIRSLTEEAARLLQEAARQEDLEKVEAQINQPQEPRTKPELANGSKIEVVSPHLYRAGELRSFKGPNAATNAYKCGRFLAAAIFGHAKSRQWCSDHGVQLRIDTEIDNRAMGENINTAGGFIVPDEFETTIIDLREQYGNARRNCRIKNMASDHSNEPKKTTGLTAYPIGENTQFTESQQGWGNVELTAKKWGVLVRISSELTEDTLISLADDIATDVAMAFATAEDNACIDGDGTSTYHGLVGIRTLMIDGNHTGSYYDGVSGSDNWSEITDTHLLTVMGQLPMYARRGAKWHCSPVCKVAVFDRLIRAAGGATMREVTDGVYRPHYMGYPIEEWPSMPGDDASAALNNKIMFFFGNMMMSSKMGSRRGVTIKRLEERYAEYDQIGIIASERFTIVHHTITGATSTARGPVVGFMGGT